MSRRHTDREYDSELQNLRKSLQDMALHVNEMIGNSVKALVDRDAELARETIASDHWVNRAEVDNDEACLVILAKRQPMGSDLRFVTLALKMVTDLERIGDLAVNICERAIDLQRDPPLKPWTDVPKMAHIAQNMVSEAIHAFVDSDVERAQAVINSDHELDTLYIQVFRDILSLMLDDGTMVERGIHAQSVAKWLERMGDHACNLAEQVIFMVEGQDIRHVGKLTVK